MIIFSPTMPHLHAPIVDEGNLIVLMHHPDKLPGQGFPGTGGVYGILNQLQGGVLGDRLVLGGQR